MADRLANIELILSQCYEGADIIESTDSFTPELLGLGERLTLKSGELLDIASEEAEHLERELIEKGTKSVYLPRLRDYIVDLKSAARCLATHLKVLKDLYEWIGDEERHDSIDEGLAVFAKASETMSEIEPPTSMEKLCQIHELALKNFNEYVAIYTKLKRAKDEGDVEGLREVESDFYRLEAEQHLESIEMFSLKDELEKAQEMLGDLKQEIGGL
ncbi:MAG: hypothetical protein H5T73_03230 [Actinobacteria bacterium]|nr:hypothetical protein [Actinomycetota bacterium]